jgi:hypothetical protein
MNACPNPRCVCSCHQAHWPGEWIVTTIGSITIGTMIIIGGLFLLVRIGLI